MFDICPMLNFDQLFVEQVLQIFLSFNVFLALFQVLKILFYLVKVDMYHEFSKLTILRYIFSHFTWNRKLFQYHFVFTKIDFLNNKLLRFNPKFAERWRNYCHMKKLLDLTVLTQSYLGFKVSKKYQLDTTLGSRIQAKIDLNFDPGEKY